MDFTALLPQLRDHQDRAGHLLIGRTIVLCLGSRALLSFMVGAHREPRRIVGAATAEAEGLALVARHRPDLLFASDRLEQGCGIALVQAVKRLHPATRTLLLVSQEHRQAALRTAIEAGCDGVVLESRIGLGSELSALHCICSGGSYIDRDLAAAEGAPALASLSPRELEVLRRLVRGDNNNEIADHLRVTVDTVKSHVRHLLLKLQARGRAHAVAIALQLGLVEWPDS